MENLSIGLSILTIILLIALMFSVRKLSSRGGEAKPKGEVVSNAPQAVAPVAGGIAPEVVAAITAAIACVWEGQSGFVVRHIRRVNHAPAWNRAGRDEQVYSRF